MDSEGLMARLYDFWHPHLEREELLFYREQIRSMGEGAALELACGAGRLLLPFLRDGLWVEGVDSSEAMLSLARAKAEKAGLTPILHHQRLEELELKSSYRLIYITLGSFQLLRDPKDANLLLHTIYASLEPGGRAIFALFLPWAHRTFESDQWVIVSDIKDRKRGERYVRREKSHHDPVAQLIEGKVRFEKWSDKDLLEMHERDLYLRWYSRGEFDLMLHQAGFTQVDLLRSYSPAAPPRSAFLLFIAHKPSF